MTEAVESVSVPESEAYILRACLWHRDAISEVSDVLKPAHFYNSFHADVWTAILSLYAEGLDIDQPTVVTRMKSLGLLRGETFGQVGHRLSVMQGDLLGKRNIMFHALLIAQAWMNREAVQIGSEAVALGSDGTEDGFDVATKMGKRIEEAMEGIAPRRADSYGSKEAEELERMDAPKKKMHTSGFPALDRVIGGYQRGDLVIVAARPAMGKSSFATSCVIEAVQQGFPTGLFSLELNQSKMQARLFSRTSGVPLAAIVRDDLTAEQIAKRHESLSEAAKMPLWIRYDTNITVDDIRAETTRMVNRHGVGCVVIDQLNWIKPPKAGNRDGEVGAITRGLKQMALQLDVCVVLLHQLNRSVETRGGDKRPKLSDLRDSGNVEQDAQVVIFLYRPDYYGITEDDQGSTIGAVDVIVEKNSNGPTETVRLRFVGETASVHGDAPQWNPRDIPKPDNRTEPTRDADEVAPF